MNRKKMFFIGGGVVLVALISIGALTRREKGSPVQVSTVSKENLQAKVSANGKVQAVKKVDISANVMGRVTRLAVKEGDPVKAGQFLLEIDPSRSQANTQGLQAGVEAAESDLASNQARFNQAKSDFARAEANRKAGIISQAEFEQTRTALSTAQSSVQSSQRRVDQAKAGVREAKVGLNYATINSPMDGVVTARRIEVGETAVMGVQNSAGTVLITVSDMSKVEAEMEVDEASIPNVKQGQAASVHIDAYPGQTFQGEVTEVGGSPMLSLSQNEAIKFKVKVWIKNPPITIKPGLSAQADIYTGSKENAVAVPFQALVMRDIKLKPGEKAAPGAPKEEEGVFLMEGGKAKFVKVKTGLMGDLNVEITSGLKGGETLIKGPNRILRDLKNDDLVHIDKSKKSDDDKKKKD
jgi:HlyD family secretion protein